MVLVGESYESHFVARSFIFASHNEGALSSRQGAAKRPQMKHKVNRMYPNKSIDMLIQLKAEHIRHQTVKVS